MAAKETTTFRSPGRLEKKPRPISMTGAGQQGGVLAPISTAAGTANGR